MELICDVSFATKTVFDSVQQLQTTAFDSVNSSHYSVYVVSVQYSDFYNAVNGCDFRNFLSRYKLADL